MTGCKNFHLIFGPIHANHLCLATFPAPNPAYQAVPFSLGSCIVTCFLGPPFNPHLIEDRDDGSCTEALGVSGLDAGEGALDCVVGLKPRMDGGGDSCVGISLSRRHRRMLVYTVESETVVSAFAFARNDVVFRGSILAFCLLATNLLATNLPTSRSRLPAVYRHC